MTEFICIFPFYFFKHKVSNSSQLKQHFLPLITDLVEKEGEKIKAPPGELCPDLTTSFNKKLLNDELFSKSELLFDCYRELASNIANNPQRRCEIKVTQNWFNYYTEKDFFEWHDHLGYEDGSNFSFVYFLSFNPTYHSSLTFKDPSHLIRKRSSDAKICGYYPNLSPNVNEGDMVVFPSYLEHCVRPYKKTANNCPPRITISGNMKIKVSP
jgi:hypothetical protein